MVAAAYRELSRRRWREWRHRLDGLMHRGKFRLAVVLFFSALFWLLLYGSFTEAFAFLHRTDLAGMGAELHRFLFTSFFFALTVMLVISNAVLGYSTFFRGRETEWLMTRPVPPAALFLYKFGETMAFSSWAFVFLGLPLLAGYATVHDTPLGFLPATLALFVLFMPVPAAMGVALAALVVWVVPRSVRSAVRRGGILLGLVAVAVLARWAASAGPRGVEAELRIAQELLNTLGFTKNPLWPSYWISEAVWSAAVDDAPRLVLLAGVITGNTLMGVTLLAGTAGFWLMRGWHVAWAGREARIVRRPRLDRAVLRGLFFLDRQVRLIVWKDLKALARDPLQMAQFLVFFGLLGIYFVNLRAFAHHEQPPLWRNLIAQLNLLATSLTLVTFASRFVFPQVSLEGRRFWIIGMVPMAREKILVGKLAMCFLVCLMVSEVLIGLSGHMLRLPREVVILQAVTLAGVCLGISGLAVGMGTLYPQFGEDNPSRIVSGFGGTLNLVTMLAFVVTAVAIQMVPSAALIRGALEGRGFLVACVASMVAVMAVSLVAGLVPLALAMRRIRTLEF